MKIIHTADWHIGNTLYGRKRYEEYEAFLNWLAGLIEERDIDVLLVAGDIFDTSTPSNRAQELYYRFLCRVAASAKRQVVIIAGNHDSPSFLDAPRELLKFLNVHIVGTITDNPEDEVLVLNGPDGLPELIVCAVPYLRDRDIRTSEPGESMEEKDRKLVEGIRSHFRVVCEAASRKQAGLPHWAPIVGMGHLFTAGGKTTGDDGVRELYIGSLARIKADMFPDCLDYLALGHLHIPQKVGGSETMRYSGSPLPVDFGEGERKKIVILLEFTGMAPRITELPVPRFQELSTLRGDWQTIAAGIERLRDGNSKAWLEIIYDGEEIIGNLTERLDEAINGSDLKILVIRNNRILERALEMTADTETLDDLDVTDVFHRCLAAHRIPEDQRQSLLDTYRETVAALNEADPHAD